MYPRPGGVRAAAALGVGVLTGSALLAAALILPVACLSAGPAASGNLQGADAQPLMAQARCVMEAVQYLGSPLSPADHKAMEAAFAEGDPAIASEAIQRVLDRYCLFQVVITPEGRVLVTGGAARPELVEKGWRQFLVKVRNESGSAGPFTAISPNALSSYDSRSATTASDLAYRGPSRSAINPVGDRWLDLQTYDNRPMTPGLSGQKLEYRVLQLYSRDAGPREASLSFNVGAGNQDVGYRTHVRMRFDCLPARGLRMRVLDENGAPTTASFAIRDRIGRVYPSQAKRLAPDLAFQPQVYLSDGETLRLPDGDYGSRSGAAPKRFARRCPFTSGRAPGKSRSGSGGGSIRPGSAGGAGTITSMPRAARTMRIPPRGSFPPTWSGTASART
jgi:hypothetical protein